jgi:hypothetical protein
MAGSMLTDCKREVILLDMLVQLRDGFKFAMVYIRLFEDTVRTVSGLGCLEVREILGASLLACIVHQKFVHMLYCGFPAREDTAAGGTSVGGSE